MRYIVLLILSVGVFKLVYDYTNIQQPKTFVQSSKATDLSQFSKYENQGRILFDDNCSSCHGKNAIGVEGAGPPFINKIYEPNHHGDIAFLRATQYGVRAHHWPYGNMPKQPQVNIEDVKKIIAYIRKLQRNEGVY